MTNDLQHTTTGNQLSTLTTQLSAATEQLKPASDDAIKAKLLSLQRSGLQWPPGMDPVLAPSIYCYALKNCSLAALKIAAEKIIQGEIPAATNYIPTPPALAVMVRKISIPFIDDVARLRATAASIEAGERVRTQNPEHDRQVERIRDLHAQFKVDHQAFKDAEAAENPGMSEAEEMRLFRNKVEILPEEDGDGEYFRSMQDAEDRDDG